MKMVGWPFAVDVSGDMEQAYPATIHFESAVAWTDEDLSLLNYVVNSFAALGEAGGLGGDRIAPTASGLTIDGDELAVTGDTSAVCQVSVMAIDARALIVLFNALTFLVRDLVRVTVSTQGVGPEVPFSVEDLPPSWPRVKFDEVDDRTGPTVDLQVDFVSPMTEAEVASAEEALQSWLDCGSIQGYRDWGVDPGKSFLLPFGDPAFCFHGEKAEAALEDSGVLEGCYDMLTNVLIKLDARTSIARVCLE